MRFILPIPLRVDGFDVKSYIRLREMGTRPSEKSRRVDIFWSLKVGVALDELPAVKVWGLREVAAP